MKFLKVEKMLPQKYLVFSVSVAAIGASLSGSVSVSSSQGILPLFGDSLGHQSNLGQHLGQPGDGLSKKDSNLEKTIFSQQTKDSKPEKDQRNIDKETKKEEKNLEKEAKRTCNISYEARNGKSKKCDPSVLEQAYPNIDFEKVDDKITDEMVKGLQEQLRSQNIDSQNIIIVR
jgi:hypothetical protein